MEPNEFISLLKGPAQICMRTCNVPISFTIAQAALESGWGKSLLAQEGKNLFGVKADRAWQGDVIEMPTREYVKGKWVNKVARWRKYKSWLDCLNDHAEFLQDNNRYKRAFSMKSGQQFARAVAAAGYATDPSYAEKLCSIIEAHNLEELDNFA